MGIGLYEVEAKLRRDLLVVQFVSRVPREVLVSSAQANSSDLPIVSDVRRITYWLPADGNMGLARQEVKVATSDDASSDPPDDPQYVIAPEVRSLTFSYWDGSSWQDSWDGTTAGSDGVTPMGPPIAVQISIELAGSGQGANAKSKTYTYVISLPTANGATQQNNTGSTGSTGSTQ